MSYRAGYSLLELLIAIAILAMLAVAVGSFAGGQNRRLSFADAAAQVEGLMRSAKLEARSKQLTISLSASADGRAILRNDEVALNLGGGLVIPAPIVFDSEGFSSGGSLKLTGDDGEALFAVEPLTGRISRPAP